MSTPPTFFVCRRLLKFFSIPLVLFICLPALVLAQVTIRERFEISSQLKGLRQQASTVGPLRFEMETDPPGIGMNWGFGNPACQGEETVSGVTYGTASGQIEHLVSRYYVLVSSFCVAQTWDGHGKVRVRIWLGGDVLVDKVESFYDHPMRIWSDFKWLAEVEVPLGSFALYEALPVLNSGETNIFWVEPTWTSCDPAVWDAQHDAITLTIVSGAELGHWRLDGEEQEDTSLTIGSSEEMDRVEFVAGPQKEGSPGGVVEIEAQSSGIAKRVSFLVRPYGKLDHFWVTAEPEEIDHGKTSTLRVIAEDTNYEEVIPEDDFDVTFRLSSPEIIPTLIRETTKRSPISLLKKAGIPAKVSGELLAYGSFTVEGGTPQEEVTVAYSLAKEGKVQYVANGQIPYGNEAEVVRVTVEKTDNPSKTGSVDITVKPVICAKILFEPGEIAPGDTALMSFKKILEDGTLEDFPEDQTFDVAILSGGGMLIAATEETGTTLSEARVPMRYVAPESIEGDSLIVMVGVKAYVSSGGGEIPTIAGKKQGKGLTAVQPGSVAVQNELKVDEKVRAKLLAQAAEECPVSQVVVKEPSWPCSDEPPMTTFDVKQDNQLCNTYRNSLGFTLVKADLCDCNIEACNPTENVWRLNLVSFNVAIRYAVCSDYARRMGYEVIESAYDPLVNRESYCSILKGLEITVMSGGYSVAGLWSPRATEAHERYGEVPRLEVSIFSSVAIAPTGLAGQMKNITLPRGEAKNPAEAKAKLLSKANKVCKQFSEDVTGFSTSASIRKSDEERAKVENQEIYYALMEEIAGRAKQEGWPKCPDVHLVTW